MRRALFGLVASLMLTGPLPGCSAVAPPLLAPAWDRAALGVNDPDLIGAMDLERLRVDPVFGPILERLAREDDMGVLMRASQIDLVATVSGGEMSRWVAVVHGVDGPPGPHDVGSGFGSLLVAPGAWVAGKGPVFDRVRAGVTSAPAAIALPDGALVASTVLGRAIPRSGDDDLARAADGLRRASFELLGGPKLELVLRCEFDDGEAADRAARLARVQLAAFAARTDVMSALARALVRLDVSVSGHVVISRVTLDDALRELLARYAEIEARR